MSKSTNTTETEKAPVMTDAHVCKKCVKKDMMDGWGRCTDCAEPSATEAEIKVAAKQFIEGRWYD